MATTTHYSTPTPGHVIAHKSCAQWSKGVSVVDDNLTNVDKAVDMALSQVLYLIEHLKFLFIHHQINATEVLVLQQIWRLIAVW